MNRSAKAIVLGLAASFGLALSSRGTVILDDTWADGKRTAEELDEATKARIVKAEAGPATIDVAKYPEQLQESYKLFTEKCSHCHKIGRAINSNYALPDEWMSYLIRMMHKPRSGINKDEAKKIFDFLVYDSATRKKAAVDEKLAKVTPGRKTATEAKIKEIRDKYAKP